MRGFPRPILQADGWNLTYTDRHGKLLLSNIQVFQEVVVQLQIEMTSYCRVTTKDFCPMGLIEGQPGGLPVANRVNQPRGNIQVLAGCLNFTKQLMKLSIRSVIGTFTGVEENQVDARLLGTTRIECKTNHISTRVEEVLGHSQKLYAAAEGSCRGKQKFRKLTDHSTVFTLVMVMRVELL